MSLVQLIHMERPDPGALTSKQLWRAWVERPTHGTGTVVTEGMVEGGRYVRTEIGASLMIDPDPVVHLQHLIAERRHQGWQDTLVSYEERFSDAKNVEEHFYEFAAPAGQHGRFIFMMDELVQSVSRGIADWVIPRQVSDLRKTPDVKRWDTELQVGRDRLKLQIGQWKNIVLSARVPVGSDADLFFTTLAASNDERFAVTMTTSDAKKCDPAERLSRITQRPEWMLNLGYEVRVFVRPLVHEPLISDDGHEYTAVVF